VNSLKQASSAVILVNVNPVVDELNKPKQTPESLAYLNEQGGYNQMVSRMNVEIASVAQSEGVPLYDYNAAMKSGAYDATKPGALISGDGIHPSPAGLQLLAEGVAYIIREKKYDTSVIVCFGDSITHGSYPEELQNSLEDGKNSH
jgi:lysophospholipase L1-like esterase